MQRMLLACQQQQQFQFQFQFQFEIVKEFYLLGQVELLVHSGEEDPGDPAGSVAPDEGLDLGGVQVDLEVAAVAE